MKGQEKHCNTCASSYYQEEKNVNGGKDMVRMQYCSDPRYNSPVSPIRCYWRTGATAAAASGPQYQRKETTMKNNYSIAQRNAIVEDHLWCIDSIIQKTAL